MTKIIAYLQLVRLPNLFTTLSNVWAGIFVASSGIVRMPQFLLVSLASAGLYTGGIVFNDYFDRQWDKIYRPTRPIPSGKVSTPAALILGIILLIGGVLSAWFISLEALVIAGVIVLTALLYDGVLKQWFLPAVLTMGLCRGLNWLLGLTSSGNIINNSLLLIPAGVLVYIAIITALSRWEDKQPALRLTVKLGIIAIPLIDGLIVLAFGYTWQAGLVASLILPTIILGKLFEMT